MGIKNLLPRKGEKGFCIMATNLNNFGMVTGRLARDVEAFANKDGSVKYRVTVAAQRNYKGRDGKYAADFLTLTKFVGNGQSAGILPSLKKGDMVAVEYTVTNNNFTDAQGTPHYEEEKTIVGFPQLRYRKTANGDVPADDENAAPAETAAPAEAPAEAPAM